MMKLCTKVSLRGFTLLETLIAVTILIFAIAGPISASQRVITVADNSRDQLTASLLAQEAIEFVRALRDNAFLSSLALPNTSQAAWNEFLTGSNALHSISYCLGQQQQSTPRVCQLDSMNAASPFSSCVADGCSTTMVVTSDGFYRQGVAGTATSFIRTLTFTEISPTEEKIDVTVSWSSRGTTRSVTLTNHLTAWQ